MRDSIPGIIKENGGSPKILELDEKQFISLLKEKLTEEVGELQKAENRSEILEELADITEILESVGHYYHILSDEIHAHKKEKRKQRGGFEKRIFLEYVDE